MMSGLGSLKVTNAYPGNRPMLSDGLPVAGRTPIEGLFVHGGMGSIGMHAAPATARWLVDAVMTGDGDPKQEWLLPSRIPWMDLTILSTGRAVWSTENPIDERPRNIRKSPFPPAR